MFENFQGKMPQMAPPLIPRLGCAIWHSKWSLEENVSGSQAQSLCQKREDCCGSEL